MLKILYNKPFLKGQSFFDQEQKDFKQNNCLKYLKVFRFEVSLTCKKEVL